MDGHRRVCRRGRSSGQLCIEILEDKLLLSGFPAVSVAPDSVAVFHKTPTTLARTADQIVAEAEQAPLGLQVRATPASRGALTRQSHEGISLLSDPDARPSDRDDGAIPESSERQQMAMLEAVSQAALRTHPKMGMPGGKGEDPNRVSSEPALEPLLQALSPDATHRAAVSASAANATGAAAPAITLRRTWVPDELAQNGPTRPTAEIAINLSELLERRSVPGSPLPCPSDSSCSISLPRTPAAGLLPFDLKALVRSMDNFLAQLADFSKNWNDPRFAVELTLWVTAVISLAFELARLQARKTLSRSLLESSIPELAILLAGDNP